MRYIIVTLFLGVLLSAQSQNTFSSERELTTYAFSQTDFEALGVDYLLDYNQAATYSQIMDFVSYVNDKREFNFAHLMYGFKILEKSSTYSDIDFETDSVLFPIIDENYGNESSRTLPLFVFDLKTHRLTESKKSFCNSWQSDSPFPSMVNSDFIEENIVLSGIFGDSIVEENIYLYWNNNTVFSNQSRTVDSVYIRIGSNYINLPQNTEYDISEINNRDGKIDIKIVFSDAEKFECNYEIYTNQPEPKTIKNSTIPAIFELLEAEYIGENPELQYKIFYSPCDDGGERLNKPFIIVAGWGPYTDNGTINSEQGWPATFFQLATQFNQEGFIENLLDVGYDVVLARFHPPNADIRNNADRIKTMINQINAIKNGVGSYEENVILGYSAGAMGSRLALQEMEHDHLENNGPHHHCKLYVSFDGEHLGANIPLGMQHSVEYVEDFYWTPPTGNLNPFVYANAYGLHYILNAIQTRQLLHYFHTATGDASNPGQGMDYWRGQYLNEHYYANHSKNTHNLDYPAFTRNISISNGRNEFPVDSDEYFPYDLNPGEHFFRHHKNNIELDAKFIQPGTNFVFRLRKKSWGNWNIEYDAVTENPWVLDNAPGGIIFIADNPMDPLVDVMDESITLNGDIKRDNALYSFTPTFLTHHIRSGFNPNTYNGIMNYSFKEKGLLYKTLSDESNELPSNDFGYPHLHYPSSHYQITPFDALFTWSTNTVHITSGEKISTNDPIEVSSSARGLIKNFIFEQMDYDYMFIQNRKFGWNARNDYIYKADFRALETIFIGSDVTQRYDFKPVEIYSNTDLEFASEEEIVISDMNIESGAQVHFYIKPYYCHFTSNLPQVDNSSYGGVSSSDPSSGYNKKETQSHTFKEEESLENKIMIYPNPGKEFTYVEIFDFNTKMKFKIHDVSGRFVHQGVFKSQKNRLDLPKGVYFIKLKINELWYIEKFIIQ